MNAAEKLYNKNQEGKFICVGLDTDINKIPEHLKNSEDAVYKFNREIIEKTHASAAAYKLNFAFYEKSGAKGFEILKRTIDLIPDDILIIGDAKRGDIGNTAKMYADSIFNNFNCDASTVNPYMGEDSVQPFLQFTGKLHFILTLTSNPGADNFEKLRLENGEFLYQRIIKKVNEWNSNGNCGIVFGATQVNDLNQNLELIGDLPVLLPGVGAQGGSLEEAAGAFKRAGRLNFLINVSRGILYKSRDEDFAEAAKSELDNFNQIVKKVSGM
jgi:orotidine-5'-phosphate decarboxylase